MLNTGYGVRQVKSRGGGQGICREDIRSYAQVRNMLFCSTPAVECSRLCVYMLPAVIKLALIHFHNVKYTCGPAAKTY